MKSIQRARAAFLVLASLVLLAAFGKRHAPAPCERARIAAEQTARSMLIPPTKGFTWRYRERSEEWVEFISDVEHQEPSRFVIDLKRVKGGVVTPMERWIVSSESLILLRRGGGDLLRPQVFFPPHGGNFTAAGQYSDNLSYRGLEKVCVPAGVFDTHCVQKDVTLGGVNVTFMYWFADGVGIVKRSTDVDHCNCPAVTELLSFGR